MAFAHRITRGWSSGGNGISAAFDISAESEYSLDISIPVVNDQLVACVIDVSQLQSLFILAGCAMKIETNSGSSPGNTFNLVAGVPFVWCTSDPALRDSAVSPALVTTDITALYVTNATAAAGLLQIRALIDPTV